jgi:hypothetical protein
VDICTIFVENYLQCIVDKTWKIKQKLNDNSFMISKADKGKTLVILPIERYKTKIHDFIQNNQFINVNTNPTDQYTKMIKHELNKQNIIQKEHKWKYSNMNPTAPNLHSTIKLHKQNTPIRPVVNWRNSPAKKNGKIRHKNTKRRVFHINTPLDTQHENLHKLC